MRISVIISLVGLLFSALAFPATLNAQGTSTLTNFNSGEAYVFVARSTTSSSTYELEYNDSTPYPAGNSTYSSNSGGLQSTTRKT